MTDKTDIAALRVRLESEANRVRDQRYVDEHCCIVNKRDLLTTVELLVQLEAERQRADKAESYARERDSENESIALTVGRLRLELAKLRGKLDTPIVIPPRKTAKDYVDDEFSNADLAAIYNAARLELKAKIKNAGFTAKDFE